MDTVVNLSTIEIVNIGRTKMDADNPFDSSSPHIELQQDGSYCGSSGKPASSVGLRDGIILGVEKFRGKSIAIVKVWHKNKFTFLKVAVSRMFMWPPNIGPTGLLVDFCVPRLFTN